MTNEEVVRILKEYQLWRRGLPPYDFGQPVEMPLTPKELGQALDHAIAVLERQERVKTRLSQIASGDYKACGHTAEDVAKTALAELCGERPAALGKAIDHSEQVLDMVTQFDERVVKIQSYLKIGADDDSWAMLLWDKVRGFVISHPSSSIGRECFEAGIEGLEEEISSLFKDMQTHIRKQNALLLEAADEIESYVEHEYPKETRDNYPDIERRYKRDMKIVNRIREEAGK